MIKVSGLPVNITKSDLDELFFAYGTIQITKISVIIKIKQTESIAHLELDKNELLAIQELDKTKWRDKHILYVTPIGGNEPEIGQPGGGGTTNKKFRLMAKDPVEASGPDNFDSADNTDQPGGGGNPNLPGGADNQDQPGGG